MYGRFQLEVVPPTVVGNSVVVGDKVVVQAVHVKEEFRIGGNWFVDVVDVTAAGNVSKDVCWVVAVATVVFFSIIIKYLPVSVHAMSDRSSTLSSSPAVVGSRRPFILIIIVVVVVLLLLCLLAFGRHGTLRLSWLYSIPIYSGTIPGT